MGLTMSRQPNRTNLATRIEALRNEQMSLSLEGTRAVGPVIPKVIQDFNKIHRSSFKRRKPSQMLNVTHFVDTDFGFHEERLKETAGMTLQKRLDTELALQRNIETVARRHINTIQSPSQNCRGSKSSQGVDNLRCLLGFATQDNLKNQRRDTSLRAYSSDSRSELSTPQSPRSKRQIGRFLKGPPYRKALDANQIEIIGTTNVYAHI